MVGRDNQPPFWTIERKLMLTGVGLVLIIFGIGMLMSN